MIGKVRNSFAMLFVFSCIYVGSLDVGAFAQGQPEPLRPLVFVPGILGTELLDDDGKVVWGDSSSLSNFEKLELGATPPQPPLHPGHLITSINVLGPFWTIHQYDGLLSVLQALNYKEGSNLFILYYDWRKSNFDNALKLKELIDGNPALKGKDIDIMAHSMGGLIVKIYLNENANDAHVARFISLAVPSRGSMNALAEMTNGWGGFENWLSGGIGTIRRVMFSFPSLYELFPSYDHCCRFGRPVQGGFTEFDPTDAKLWQAGDWIPPEERTGPRLANVLQDLDNARKLKAILRQPLPPTIEQTLIAGDKFSTNLYLYVDPNVRTWEHWHFSQSVGDGTVPLWSAANSDWPGQSLPAFTDHATIFDDKGVVNKLQRMLNKNAGPPPIAMASLPLARTASDRLVEISMVKAEFDKSVVKAGDGARLTISIVFVDPIAKGDLQPNLMLSDPTGSQQLPVQDTTSVTDEANRTLSFSASVSTSPPGAYSVRISIPGMGGAYSRDIVALPPHS
ncbi:lipase/acyltransferase domain-containing protein [Mesorhizobium sp. 128a]